jgi:hypothetical protein
MVKVGEKMVEVGEFGRFFFVVLDFFCIFVAWYFVFIPYFVLKLK